MSIKIKSLVECGGKGKAIGETLRKVVVKNIAEAEKSVRPKSSKVWEH